MNKDDVAALAHCLKTKAKSVAIASGCDADLTVDGRAADALTTLSARVETLEAALRFYADEENPRAWAQQTVTDAQNPCGRRNVGEPTPTPALLFDQGSIARQALAGE